MPRRFPVALGRIVERMAKLSPPRHRDLVRGMMAELDSIADPGERTRFALGAIGAITRLAVGGFSRTTVHAPGRFVSVSFRGQDGTGPGGPSMSKLTTRQLLGRHATPFAVSFASLTVLLLANYAAGWVRRGAQADVIGEVLLLSVPFTLALTIPMAVFLTVSWVFSRLGAEGALASARRTRHGIRRLVAPVLGVAAIVGTLNFVLNTQVLPRANARLVAVLADAPRGLSEREMTMSELRDAARRTRTAGGVDAATRAVVYEVELQKRLALAVACMVLALAGAATAIRFPRGGVGLVLGASALVFTGYYLSLVAGEALADRQVVSPWLGMWMANAFLLAVALLLAWGPSRPDPLRGVETLAIGG